MGQGGVVKKYLYWLAYGAALNGLMSGQGAAQSAGAQPSATGEAPTSELQEVIVSANRRSENLQAVPMTVSVVTADTLANEGITDTASIQNAVPGLVIGNVAGFSEPFIRGVGTTATSAGSEASVATYVDGVYIASETAALFSLNNIAQVEVLKGPQGTLFGRNATGGVIQILTKDPTQETKVDASVGYSNYQTYEGSLYATTGVAPDLAADVAVYANKQDGGWGHYADGQKAYTGDDVSVRSKWLWTPAAGTRITLSGDYSRNVSQEGLAFSIYPGAVGSTGQRSGGFYDPSGSYSYGRDVQEGGSLKLEQDFGWARLINIAAYRHADFKAPFDYDDQLAQLEYATFFLPSRTESEELQLASVDSSTIKWIVGAIYFSSDSTDDPLQLQLPFVTIRAFAPQSDKSYAVYGQTTVPLPGDNNLTLGARYSIDQIGINGFATINGSPPLDAAAQSERYGKPTWRFAFDHEFNTDLRGYVSYNRGVKSGLYNEDTYYAPPVKPEELDAYEGGIQNGSPGAPHQVERFQFLLQLAKHPDRRILGGISILRQCRGGPHLWCRSRPGNRAFPRYHPERRLFLGARSIYELSEGTGESPGSGRRQRIDDDRRNRQRDGTHARVQRQYRSRLRAAPSQGDGGFQCILFLQLELLLGT